MGGSSTKILSKMGVAGFWNDMNEPALFVTPTKTMPLDNRHRLDDGTTWITGAIHNMFGMQNVRGTYDGLRKLRPNERPFVLTRAAYAGTQRYAATWTGDNSSTWNHIRMSTPLMLNMGLSGLSVCWVRYWRICWIPADGFVDSMDRARCVQSDLPRPHRQRHERSRALGRRPEQETIRRSATSNCATLLPYTYTAVEETTRTGLPIMRPLFLEYPQTAAFYDDDRDFFLAMIC